MTARMNIRFRPTYANVVSTLALALVLSGGAYAATQLPKDSVKSKQIKNGSVKAKDIKAGEIEKKVADRPSFDDMEEYVAQQLQGDQQQLSDTGSNGGLAGPSYIDLVAIPDVVDVDVRCIAAGGNRGMEVRLTNLTTAPWTAVVRQESQSAPALTVGYIDVGASGGQETVVFAPDTGVQAARMLELTMIQGVSLRLEVAAVTNNAVAGCNFTGSVVYDVPSGV